MNDEPILLDFSDFQNREPVKRRKSYFGRVDEYSLEGEYLCTWDSITEAALHYKVSLPTIGCCCNGRTLLVHKLSKIFLKEGDDIKKRLKSIKKEHLRATFKPYRVSVNEYDINGNFITSWKSIADICNSKDYPKIYPGAVVAICKGKSLHSKNGRVFLFENETIEERLQLIKDARYQKEYSKSIDEYSKNGALIKHWKSALYISKECGIPVKQILDSCLGKVNSTRGKIYLFSRDSIEKRLRRIKSKKRIKC